MKIKNNAVEQILFIKNMITTGLKKFNIQEINWIKYF